ncbi:MAG: hypothetical protein M1838_005890 [Thelocarpon superellum]|nr:MAG: hypothetical protein M1838_005890 [Thelocarpon superellum]
MGKRAKHMPGDPGTIICANCHSIFNQINRHFQACPDCKTIHAMANPGWAAVNILTDNVAPTAVNPPTTGTSSNAPAINKPSTPAVTVNAPVAGTPIVIQDTDEGSAEKRHADDDNDDDDDNEADATKAYFTSNMPPQFQVQITSTSSLSLSKDGPSQSPPNPEIHVIVGTTIDGTDFISNCPVYWAASSFDSNNKLVKAVLVSEGYKITTDEAIIWRHLTESDACDELDKVLDDANVLLKNWKKERIRWEVTIVAQCAFNDTGKWLSPGGRELVLSLARLTVDNEDDLFTKDTLDTTIEALIVKANHYKHNPNAPRKKVKMDFNVL